MTATRPPTTHEKLMTAWINAPSDAADRRALDALARHVRQCDLRDRERAGRRSTTRKGKQ